MTDVNELLTENLDIWTSAIEKKFGAGRGNGGAVNAYGIKKLRSLLQELAVRGKLVPQNVDDVPVNDLLRTIARERNELFKTGNPVGKWSAPLSFKAPDRVLPSGWKWVPLANVLNWHVGGGTPSKTQPEYWNGGIPWASVKDVGHTKFLKKTLDQISAKGLKNSSSNLVPKGCLLIITRMGLGRLSINEIDVAINQDLRALSVSSEVSLEFCYLFFQTLKLEGAGLTVKGIKIDDLLSSPFPLPPVAEQHRIVAKVDELMRLCDTLEMQTEASMEVHETLVEACLVALANSQTHEDLARSWTRLETHFDTLFTTEVSIQLLEDTLQELAVSGKLVEQVPSEARTNQSLLRPDEVAEKFDLSAFAARSKLFPLPEGWTIEPLSRVASHVVDCPHTTPIWTDEGELCIKSEQIFAGRIDLSKPNFVSNETYIERIERLVPEPEDILYKREGGILGLGARIPPDTKVCLGQRLMLIRAGEAVRPDYLELVLNSPWTRRFAAEKTTGGAAPRVNMAVVRAYPIPVPPLQEQARIIERVRQLAKLCRKIRKNLQIERELQVALANTLVEEVA